MRKKQKRKAVRLHRGADVNDGDARAEQYCLFECWAASSYRLDGSAASWNVS